MRPRNASLFGIPNAIKLKGKDPVRGQISVEKTALKIYRAIGTEQWSCVGANLASIVYSPEHRYARSPSLLQAKKRVKE